MVTFIVTGGELARAMSDFIRDMGLVANSVIEAGCGAGLAHQHIDPTVDDEPLDAMDGDPGDTTEFRHFTEKMMRHLYGCLGLTQFLDEAFNPYRLPCGRIQIGPGDI